LTPFPPLYGSSMRAWRIDRDIHMSTWDSGIGAFGAGGRWNPRGVSAIYASFDAATAIVEVAVHKGFTVLDTVPHVITAFEVDDASKVHIVMPPAVPNPHWLVPAIPTPGQQKFGADLLSKHLFVAIPSTVSQHSWNLIFDPARAAGHYKMVLQQRLAIDPRFTSLPAAAPAAKTP